MVLEDGGGELKVIIMVGDWYVGLYVLGGERCVRFWKCNNEFLELWGKGGEVCG